MVFYRGFTSPHPEGRNRQTLAPLSVSKVRSRFWEHPAPTTRAGIGSCWPNEIRYFHMFIFAQAVLEWRDGVDY
jgi:hypothetical protein